MSLTQPGNPEHLKAAFWIACMDAQVWEMKEALAHNDFDQLRKELADCALVAMDAIRLMKLGDSNFVIWSRLAQNLSKFTEEALKVAPRDTNWYLAKIEKIKKGLGESISCFYCHNPTPRNSEVCESCHRKELNLK